MSSAHDRMPPAAFMLSFSSMGWGITPVSRSAWGMATFIPAVSAVCRVRLEAMPTRFRMRSATKSSQVRPLTASMSSPAAT